MAASRPASAFARFFAHESAGGVVLAAAALAALAVSNSAWGDAYRALLALPGEVRIGGDALVLAKPLLVWVNDLWMALFFFLVGLEIKREFAEGELASPRQALLPAAAALGGMVAPAAIYAAINHADPVALRGWAIPAATDIAFTVGILMLLGARVPASLKVFVTAVAIIDDLGAIVVIALFYTEQLSAPALAAAGLGALLLLALNRARVMRVEAYALVGLLVWLAVLKSGVHATLAGVVTALAVPVRDAEGGSPLERVEQGLHPWVAFGVLPVFAFCNAGVSLAGASWATLAQPIPLGIALGLVAGKAVGVLGTSWLLIASGIGERPAQATWTQFAGVAVLCGIGFTMSLFIGSLAFEGQGPAYELQLKLGVLGGSLVAALLGSAILWRAGR
ncbi:MAG TPA: Na+/H+ antiporter NhaA [Burkholderiaceae bacterium]